VRVISRLVLGAVLSLGLGAVAADASSAAPPPRQVCIKLRPPLPAFDSCIFFNNPA
jgi:hypothetical protein